ncbi:pyrroloquinoline-quinone synthase PqqC [Psychrobium sp. 1_MG-2023]|uniref:pyrroloquinoline-quinone synthase PqqC n=1 Tax=Psychrobium sp. 1_MG-2023 TaxID=3062624 RepID=UPI000C322E0B|nr:pyrroloquinoline-quinone synthase PqqC [Psychrobium sp. 1_MG-2023]MDP2561571.1 pyrroloquinoline-quinone synthase PqqC [Psychrobium sp. 1_MG-2023]PKF55032.1 pyrroloquinoline quinone biosynthesis protein C [Alteromonadales bacterium alter-6D02]
MSQPLTKEQFEKQLREKGALYHIYHPFHIAMHNGECSKEQIQGWVANRFYYQVNIPVKDAAIMANCRDINTRRQWIQRILDHDGSVGDETLGGIEAWLQLGEAVGLTREQLLSQELVLPGVRFAVDAYVNFARRASWEEAACSSLTEMFAPEIHQSRLDSWPDNYPWIDKKGLEYFQMRLSQARRDVNHGLQITLDHFKTAEQQAHALNILQFKLDILWSMLDAMTMAYDYKRAPYHGIIETPSYHQGIF